MKMMHFTRIGSRRLKAGLETVVVCQIQDLGCSSEDDAFYEDWKQEVESRVRDCSSMSNSCEDGLLDGAIELAEIAR